MWSRPYMGKVLWADLGSRATREEEIPDELYQQVLAGMGLAAKILMREIPKDADPMGPDNVLALVPGLLTGTGAQMAGRWMAAAKSPLTGGWGDANGGGDFSPSIKRAGYDGIFIKGVSENPVYLNVTDEKAEIKDASHLWGLDTVETEERLKQECGKSARVACIGPAGENLSLISGIVNQGARIAARSGMGAVMGSKRLKAVVASGKQKVAAHDPETISKLSREFSQWIKEGDKGGKFMTPRINRFIARFMRFSPLVFGAAGDMMRTMLRTYGTIVNNIIGAETGDSPIMNWKGTPLDFPLATHSGKLNPGNVLAHQKKRYHCYSCPLGCGGVLDLSSTNTGLTHSHKPEYETMSSFGSLILNNDIEAIYKINDIMNRAGMDTISAGSAVAFAMECFEQGVLTKEDADGLDLSWGNPEAVVELAGKMVKRQGLGDLLADGAKKASERLGKGSQSLAMHAGGQDLPMHDGRLDPGFAVAYSMEPTPARHTNYAYLYLEMFALHKIFPGLPKVDMLYKKAHRLDTRDREKLLSAASKFVQVVNGSGVCLFAVQCGPSFPLIKYLDAATGWDKSASDYLDMGERIQHMRQAFNVVHGKVPARDFKLPDRARGEPPLQAGPLKGVRIPLAELNQNFAAAMGWDHMGRPLADRLRQLGLDDLAGKLETF